MTDDEASGGIPLDELYARAPHIREFIEFLPALIQESDRGMALIATSFLDEILRRLIAGLLVDCRASKELLEGPAAPLSTFYARINMAIALGIISEGEGKEANRLRRVRNHFAHEIHASFNDAKIRGICSELAKAGEDEGELDDKGNVKSGSRNDFSNSAMTIINRLINRTARGRRRLEAARDE